MCRVGLIVVVVVVALSAGLGSASAGWTESVISRLVDAQGGNDPGQGLMMDKAGNLYGVTADGGPYDAGTVFKLTPPSAGNGDWTKTTLYVFGNHPDAERPVGALIMDATGALYGATRYGGKFGRGTVYRLTPPAGGGSSAPWTETLLYSFKAELDGWYPEAGLALDANGNLLGTTSTTAKTGTGIVFKLAKPAPGRTDWIETIIYSFRAEDGINPKSPVVADASGAVYGSTSAGGLFGNGTIFKLTPPGSSTQPWSFKVLHAFRGGGDGATPEGPLTVDSAGDVFGTTSGGGHFGDGIVYVIAPVGKPALYYEFILHTFGRETGGAPTKSGVVLDAKGNLYGTTYWGGASGLGTVFKLSQPATINPPWVLNVLHNFRGSPDGVNPESGVILDNAGNLYGMASRDQDYDASGIVFRLTP